jgi:hypothetical protein
MIHMIGTRVIPVMIKFYPEVENVVLELGMVVSSAKHSVFRLGGINSQDMRHLLGGHWMDGVLA